MKTFFKCLGGNIREAGYRKPGKCLLQSSATSNDILAFGSMEARGLYIQKKKIYKDVRSHTRYVIN